MPTSSRSPRTRSTEKAANHRVARAAQPLARFFELEAASGILLFAATIGALLWANSPWRGGYHRIWETAISVRAGSFSYDTDLRQFVDDGLMALFFFVVGMEIKRELVAGQLRGLRRAALPGFAALGGMVVPALIYVAINSGDGGATSGWGIPMATDIAFALGVVAILGRRVPAEAKVLLLSLAIVDDIGAIVVIAVFYSDSLHSRALLTAAGLVVVLAVLHRVEVRHPLVLVAVGLALWLATQRSGVHPTIAGVAAGLLTPARPASPGPVSDAPPERSACDRLIDIFHPWTSFVIVPVFALANAGVPVSATTITPSRVSIGVGAGLVLGKLAGISGATVLALRLRLAEASPSLGGRQIAGVAALGGIGFTVALFITGLAFDDPAVAEQARVGALAASVLAAAIGVAVFVAGSRRRTPARSPISARGGNHAAL